MAAIFPVGFRVSTDTGRSADEQEIFASVRQLLHLRERHPALRTGEQQYVGSGGTYLAYSRFKGETGF
jgi:hypothetical protein